MFNPWRMLLASAPDAGSAGQGTSAKGTGKSDDARLANLVRFSSGCVFVRDLASSMVGGHQRQVKEWLRSMPKQIRPTPHEDFTLGPNQRNQTIEARALVIKHF